MKIEELPTPVIFAHRGASAYAPENTLTAFKLAIEQGAHALELDTKLSADGQAVVIHDQTVDRTTNSIGHVADLTLTELRQLDAGSHFDVRYQGEKIPTLAEVFESFGKRILINVELTNYATPADKLPIVVADMAQRFNLVDQILFSSFNPLALFRIKKHLPDATIGLLALPGFVGLLMPSFSLRLFSYYSLHPEWSSITPKLVLNAHKHNKKIFPYTVNRVEDIAQMIKHGVDGLFTDNPIQALRVNQTIAEKVE